METLQAAFARVLDDIRATAQRASVEISDAIDDLTDELALLWGNPEPLIPQSGPDWREMGLSPIQTKFCELLHKNIGRNVSREALRDWAYGSRKRPGERTTDVQICKARQTLAGTPYWIEGAYGGGYRMSLLPPEENNGIVAQRIEWHGHTVAPETAALGDLLIKHAGKPVSWLELAPVAPGKNSQRITDYMKTVRKALQGEYDVRSEWGMGYVAIPVGKSCP